MHFGAEPGFVWILFAVMAVGALLRIRFEEREDHIVLSVGATVAAAILGLGALVLIWAAVLVAVVVLRRRQPIVWLVVTSLSISAGFLAGWGLYSQGFGRDFPMPVRNMGEVLIAGVTLLVAWSVTMAIRVLTIRAMFGNIARISLDPVDSALLPYLIALMGGFPLVVASVALYRPGYPWSSAFILWWCFPLYFATAFDVNRRRVAMEMRSDLLAKQRLAAIGEVSARIAHQSRHQVGLMGWSIHRLRNLARETVGAEGQDALHDELAALAEAKDRLSEMLTTELTSDDTMERGTDRCSLAGLVNEVVAQLEDKAAARGLEVTADTARAAGIEVPVALRDVVFNLVDNAIDAARTRVEVIAGMDLVVRDDGPGVDPENTDRIFEPFFTTKGDGTGMGLAVADAVVSGLGGEVRYERSSGSTAFIVTYSGRECADRHGV